MSRHLLSLLGLLALILLLAISTEAHHHKNDQQPPVQQKPGHTGTTLHKDTKKTVEIENPSQQPTGIQKVDWEKAGLVQAGGHQGFDRPQQQAGQRGLKFYHKQEAPKSGVNNPVEPHPMEPQQPPIQQSQVREHQTQDHQLKQEKKQTKLIKSDPAVPAKSEDSKWQQHQIKQKEQQTTKVQGASDQAEGMQHPMKQVTQTTKSKRHHATPVVQRPSLEKLQQKTKSGKQLQPTQQQQPITATFPQHGMSQQHQKQQSIVAHQQMLQQPSPQVQPLNPQAQNPQLQTQNPSQQPQQTSPILSILPGMRRISDSLYISEVPARREQLLQLKKAGFEYLVNVGDDEKMEGGKQKLGQVASEAGLKYLELDMEDEDDWKQNKILKVDHLLRPLTGKKSLIVGESVSHAGGFFAMYAAEVEKTPIDEALTLGREYGLDQKHEQKIREFLENKHHQQQKQNPQLQQNPQLHKK